MIAVEKSDWEEIDPWWNVHAEGKQEELQGLYGLMQNLSKEWQESNSRFNKDPLAVDWSENSSKTGPLRTGQEENWSDWLAHLFRASSGFFLKELFGKDYSNPPQKVEREKWFQEEAESNRRADILLYYKDRGISIEVKLDDENYEKTAHTAYLVEKLDDRNWKHFLLLPGYKEGALKNTPGVKLEYKRDSTPTILSRHCNVEVIYWKDVSKALRKSLLHSQGLDPHWEASAYLFVSLIEQKVFNIHPKPFVEKNVVKKGEVSFSDVERIKSIDVGNQLEYLSEFVEGKNHG